MGIFTAASVPGLARPGLAGVLALVLAQPVLGANANPMGAQDGALPRAVAPKPVRPLPGAPVELTAADGWKLKAVYRAAAPDQPTFLLLHGRGRRMEWWRRLAVKLSAQGYGYLAWDLRGHGGSQTAPDGSPLPWRKFKATKIENDWAQVNLDIMAAVAYLQSQGVAEESIALAGADVGGSLALKYAAVRPKVPMLILFSPGMSYQEILTVNAMRAYKDRPILLVYGELDKTSARATPILYEFARRSAGERNAAVMMVPKRHGHQLLSSEVVAQVLEWIAEPVKPEVAVDSSTQTVVSPQGPVEAPGDDETEETVQ